MIGQVHYTCNQLELCKLRRTNVSMSQKWDVREVFATLLEGVRRFWFFLRFCVLSPISPMFIFAWFFLECTKILGSGGKIVLITLKIWREYFPSRFSFQIWYTYRIKCALSFKKCFLAFLINRSVTKAIVARNFGLFKWSRKLWFSYFGHDVTSPKKCSQISFQNWDTLMNNGKGGMAVLKLTLWSRSDPMKNEWKSQSNITAGAIYCRQSHLEMAIISERCSLRGQTSAPLGSDLVLLLLWKIDEDHCSAE